MSFKLNLTPAERAVLTEEQERLGLRSHADVLRVWIAEARRRLHAHPPTKETT